MSYSFIVFSDLHIHEWSYGSKIISGYNSRLIGQVDAVLQLVRYAKEHDVQDVFFSGDFFHTSTVTAEVSQAATDIGLAFKKNNLNLYVIDGNHDQANKDGSKNALYLFKGWDGGIEYHGHIDEPIVLPRAKDIEMYFSSFTHDKEVLKSRLKKITPRSLVFLHQGVGGVEINSKGFTLNEILTPDMVPECLQTFTGHYHSHKHVTDRLTIPGSLIQLNWGDTGECRGWLHCQVDGDYIRMDQIKSKASKFVQIHSPAELPNDQIVGNFIRLVTEDHNPSFIEDAARELSKAGAESVEVKTVIQLDKSVQQVETKQFNSLNEIIYAYAYEKERAGVITEYDRLVGEQLLKDNYQVPTI
ncbi:MAG TPA: metallophosphoesterase [Candidatus Hodarchaeales archaeon]|nr:metallophosphoesterase [Candidatus Hodarchaeales archaeon]